VQDWLWNGHSKWLTRGQKGFRELPKLPALPKSPGLKKRRVVEVKLLLAIACLLTSTIVASLCSHGEVLQHEIAEMKAGSCSLPDSGVVNNCILRHQDGTQFVSPEVLKEVKFDAHGLAPVRVEDDCGPAPVHVEQNPCYLWMYVNRKGRVVINGVPTFDNLADEFSGGLVRTVVNGKYGFANRQGRIVIKPAYDWASRFEHGYAEVCYHCREMCAMPGRAAELESMPGGCDHHIMVGGQWFKMDKKGRVVARLRTPS
jgi:hypothetical protein